ncbi:helicase protein [Porphyromonas gingivalis F0185]|uniref:DEAD/DEAH box helicase n=1 Tax=Porphyromonas gingivalis TaxID=837 RepID=UPI0003AD40C7|nr:DEAD/DEAH box helicase family protein [Porphyromonas gingivalis]ERJ86359.1 helicase protein [Porphyromonas gingivalis F0185]PDP63657.1 restriction endonuclease [Porphyromonas gingivalis]
MGIYIGEALQERICIGKNKVIRIYRNSTLRNELIREIVSTTPFVVNINGAHILLIRRLDDINIDRFDYVVLVSSSPTRAKFNRGDIKFVRWIKNPVFSNESPEYIVNSWKGKFLYTKEDESINQKGLRSPQLGALYAYLSKAQNPQDRSIVVMPTGTGKTETMLSILVANQCQKVLVTVPSDALREQLFAKFISLGVLPELGIVTNQCALPLVAIIKENMDINDWERIINASNVIITTMPLVAQAPKETITMLSRKVSHLFVDEAHHSEAKTWDDVICNFPDKKVVLFTATPFRNDGKKLQGDFIYSFSLKDAQEQGYYQPIKFTPVREYVESRSDKVIAETAVAKLRSDLEHGFDHILMARCSTKKRANEIFKYYQEHNDLNPIVVYSSMPNQASVVKSIKAKRHRIIVCVNMLGEGFDLPEMKIAAIHDSRQSLAVTLQFIGRFTRTSHSSNLGEATFITNIACPPIAEELQGLYASDADWNFLLPIISDGVIDEEVNFNEFINSFNGLEKSKISFRNIVPALSSVIYRTKNTWNPNAWETIYTEEQYTYRFGVTNDTGDTLVVILGSIENVEWGNTDGLKNLLWNIIIVHRYCTDKYNHAYINSSFSIDTDKLVFAIFGEEEVSKISGDIIFRVLSGVKRFAVVNFGGRKGRQGYISFKSYYGKDVQEGIGLTEQGQLIKNNLFGNGFRNGEKTSIGCSIKGKVWSYMRGNLLQFTKWSKMIGGLVEDSSLDPNEILRNTLKVQPISSLPNSYPIAIEWDSDLYKKYSERSIYVRYNREDYCIWDIDLQLTGSFDCQKIEFEIIARGEELARYKLEYGENENSHTPFYRVVQTTGNVLGFRCGSQHYNNICDYFNQDYSAPVVFFADGSQLFANNLVKVNESIKSIDLEYLDAIKWEGVNLSNESQHVIPYETDSIQYFFSHLIMDEFDVLYDDDGSGEIADLIGIKDKDDAIHFYLYHLKYALQGCVSNRISNFYEVCGQAQRSLKWNDQDRIKDFFTRLFARKEKRYQGRVCSRILKGTEADLERFSKQVNWQKKMVMHIGIVQPALSKSQASQEILELLGTIWTYIKDISNIELKVYCSE